MTTGVLHDHLDKCHASEYIDACKTNGWDIKIKSFGKQHSLSTPDVVHRAVFSMASFKTALVNWIVADDQV
jgi:hypothetical protein